MARTTRKWEGNSNNPPKVCRDGELINLSKDKKPKKSFMFRGDGWSSKARGGVGNKAGWKVRMPKWLYKKLKKENVYGKD